MSACTDICYIGYWESIWINRFCHMECQSSGQLSGWNMLEPLRAKSKLCCIHCKEHLSKWVSKVTFDGFLVSWCFMYINCGKVSLSRPFTTAGHARKTVREGWLERASGQRQKLPTKTGRCCWWRNLFTCVPANETQPLFFSLHRPLEEFS